MRITRHFFAAAVPPVRGAEYLAVPLPDHQSRPPSASSDEFESDDARDLWSAWIDLGGEG
jgi:hypothetical protein